MTAATLAIGGRFRPPFTTTTGARMTTDDRRQRPRLIVTIDPAAGDALDALAAARFGGVKSRAVDACLLIGAAVLNNPATWGMVDPLESLAAHCAGQDDGGERP